MTNTGNLRVRELIADVRERLNELERLYDIDQVVSCSEAAAFLNVAATTISRYIAVGKLHKIKRGGRIGISISELTMIKKKS